MNYTFSTVLMTVLTSNLLIVVIALCFRNRKIMLSIGYKLLIVFLVLTAIRFLLPVELPFSRNIYFPEWLSAVVAFVQHVFISFGIIKVSISSLLGLVWLGGSLYHFRRFCRRKSQYRHFVVRYGNNMNRKEPYQTMMAEICGKRRNPLWVVRAPYYSAPMQYGTFRPYIVLPTTMELSEEELYYVLRHETAHYYHHDAFIKDAISIIRAIYWWNPLCRLLEEKTDILLEMRVDDTLIDGDAATREAYCRTLDHISEKLQEDPSIPGMGAALSMATLKGEDLRYREIMMHREKGRKSILFFLLAGFVAAAYICSYCFIFEAYLALPWDKEGRNATSDDCLYAIPCEDGTYDIYMYYDEMDVYLENVDSLEYYIGISIRGE